MEARPCHRLSLLYLCLCLGLSGSLIQSQAHDLYSFNIKDARGNYVSLEKYRGKPSLVINVASECGYTDSHYEALAQLSRASEIKDHLNILAFPCNQFGAQEPGTDQEIIKFAKDNYSVDFPIFSKIDVIGENAHPIYQYLAENGGISPSWNFWKYLVDANGQVINAWGPETSVHDLWNDLVMVGTRKVQHDDL